MYSCARLAKLEIPVLVAQSIAPAGPARERGLSDSATSRRRETTSRPAEPQRKSRRLEGLGAVNYNEAALEEGRRAGKFLTGTRTSSASDAEPPARRALDDLPLDALNLLAAAGGDDADDADAAKDALPPSRQRTVAAFVKRSLTHGGSPERPTAAAPAATMRRRGGVAAFGSGSTPASATEVRANQWWLPSTAWVLDETEGIAKVTHDRIYRIAFVPRADRIVLAAGDKSGHLGLWDASAQPDRGETELLLVRPHRNVVSTILVRCI